MKSSRIIALVGNPNVGKSTIFNGLTGMKQHTGNWTGKTVANARGQCSYKDQLYTLVDIPGIYSLTAHSAEEEIAREFLCHGNPDAVVVICDATCLERNLQLALQIMEISPKVIVCVNLMDEAEKKGIHIDLPLLSERLGVPVVSTVARSRKSLSALLDAIYQSTNETGTQHISAGQPDIPRSACSGNHSGTDLISAAESIFKETVTMEKPSWQFPDWKLDKILTGRITGYPIMVILLAFLLWLTIAGANYPSRLLADLLFRVQDLLTEIFTACHAPEWLHGILVLGIYRVVAWVVSVMLPPMAIFFPLFTLLEDGGYLPRIAYNLDRPFQCCHACGKQALTMCMDFSCLLSVLYLIRIKTAAGRLPLPFAFNVIIFKSGIKREWKKELDYLFCIL